MISNIIPQTDWEMARKGCFTSSEIWRLFTEPRSKQAKEQGQISDTASSYIMEKATELVTGTVRVFQNNATEWGKMQEPFALEKLQEQMDGIEIFGTTNQKFFKAKEFLGGSPDAYHPKNHIVFEIKCPENFTNHLQNLLITSEEELFDSHKEYWYQIQCNMFCLARELGIPFSEMEGMFVSFAEEFPPHLQLHSVKVSPSIPFETAIEIIYERAEKELKKILQITKIVG